MKTINGRNLIHLEYIRNGAHHSAGPMRQPSHKDERKKEKQRMREKEREY